MKDWEEKKLEQLRYPAVYPFAIDGIWSQMSYLLLWEIYGVLSSIDMDID